MKKRCTKCGEVKMLKFFSPRKKVDGSCRYSSWCHACTNKVSKEWGALNKERTAAKSNKWNLDNPGRHAATSREWYVGNKEHVAITAKKWIENNPGRHAATSREWRIANPGRNATASKEWNANNPGKTATYCRARQAAKLQAIPPWLTEKDKKKIEKIYEKAAKLGLTVDHEIPLRGKGVRGLHVPWNLQFLTGNANSSKGNRYSHDG